MATYQDGGLVFVNGVPTPIRPKQIWLLRAVQDGTWVPSLDDAPGGQTFLVAFSEEEALAAAGHQREIFLSECEAVCFEVKQAEG